MMYRHCIYCSADLGQNECIERFPVGSAYSLHVRESDMAAGKYEGIGRWKEVIVGDPLWRTL